ncbi:GyrI-like domain-containing protein [Desulfitibacter alkalitolerans]|uniref:GyrI-like domain-containing protein n=1 Tax=Desulfitibacter alkalitolerans TaxID=264641 RepID=UPI0004814097|nr:GyrI-like domain-containing protein [Desulfitibacter alkalitolerans]
MEYKFEIFKQEAQPVLSIRKRTSVDKLSDEIGKAYGVIMEYMNEVGEQPLEAPFVAYYNLDMSDLDVEMGFPVSKPIAGRGDINQSKIPASRCVSYLYKGPYNGMEPVYNAMTQWIAEQGYTPTGIAYEYYFNSPNEVPESELLTKIVFPLK